MGYKKTLLPLLLYCLLQYLRSGRVLFQYLETALNNNSISLKNAERKNKTAIIIGNEANGVSSDILEISDFIIKIPNREIKRNLY